MILENPLSRGQGSFHTKPSFFQIGVPGLADQGVTEGIGSLCEASDIIF